MCMRLHGSDRKVQYRGVFHWPSEWMRLIEEKKDEKKPPKRKQKEKADFAKLQEKKI